MSTNGEGEGVGVFFGRLPKNIVAVYLESLVCISVFYVYVSAQRCVFAKGSILYLLV